MRGAVRTGVAGTAGQGRASQGVSWQARTGLECRVMSGLLGARHGLAGEVSFNLRGLAWCARRVTDRNDIEWHGELWQARNGQVSYVMDWHGEDRQGRQGVAG